MYFDKGAGGGKFVASWQDEHGHRRRKRFATKDAALAQEHEQCAMTAAYLAGRSLDLAVHGMRGKTAVRAELVKKAIRIICEDDIDWTHRQRVAYAEVAKKAIQIIAGPRREGGRC